MLGVGLLLIHGIEVDSSWTHLIPGLLVSGIGVGMINTPLASTAVGVVTVDRSGMASGINSTFRQVGIATGIAVLGTIFAHQVADGVRDVAWPARPPPTSPTASPAPSQAARRTR